MAEAERASKASKGPAAKEIDEENPFSFTNFIKRASGPDSNEGRKGEKTKGRAAASPLNDNSDLPFPEEGS